MHDPVELSRQIEKIVTRKSTEGLLRKYYRFRAARFYGGIATADAVGCNLNCAFCWVNEPRKKPQKYGEFYSAKEVAKKLEGIARQGGFSKVRVSGAEPTIGKQHLLELVSEMSGYLFILETNGILLGHDESYAKEFAGKKLHVRVALKGASREEFSILTNAKPEFFGYQLKALENLKKYDVSFHAAIMTFSNLQPLLDRLRNIEELMVFPHVEKEMGGRKILQQIEALR